MYVAQPIAWTDKGVVMLDQRRLRRHREQDRPDRGEEQHGDEEHHAVAGRRVERRQADGQPQAGPQQQGEMPRDLAPDENERVKKLSTTFIAKDTGSGEKLLAETALFQHRAISAIPKEQQILVKTETSDRLRGKKILIVDDDLRNIFSLTSALEP